MGLLSRAGSFKINTMKAFELRLDLFATFAVSLAWIELLQ